jgi:hypothetical protein
MTVPPVERVRIEALVDTGNHAESIGLFHSADGLKSLELFITSENPAARPRQEEDLIEAIAGNSGFMIALVFSHDHKKVVALPLPEVLDIDDQRVQVGFDCYKLPADLLEIKREVFRSLARQSNIPTPGVRPDVVLIEQNLGRYRKGYPITVACLNTQIDYLRKDQYMIWIQVIQEELNGRPSSGK